VRPALRWGLAALGASALFVGVPALLAPRGFFDHFPFVAHWVDLLGPYNQHLTTDVGALYLGFALLFFWAAATLRRALAVPLCTAWAVVAALHLLFHVTHLDGFGTADAVAQTASLAALVAAPLALLALLRRER
jgi:hypothetical protein